MNPVPVGGDGEFDPEPTWTTENSEDLLSAFPCPDRKRQWHSRMSVRQTPHPIRRRHQNRQATPRQNLVLTKHRSDHAGANERTEDCRQ